MKSASAVDLFGSKLPPKMGLIEIVCFIIVKAKIRIWPRYGQHSSPNEVSHHLTPIVDAWDTSIFEANDGECAFNPKYMEEFCQ